MYEDKCGRILLPDEVDELSDWEIEELGVQAYRETDLYLPI